MKQALAVFLIFIHVLPASAQKKAIDEKRYITIGGIEQWVTIKGSDITRPVVLLLHGGPGSVMSPYETITKEWEKNFIIVNWDQRCAGRTYSRNAPAETDESYWIKNPLTVQQMTTDGLELTGYLLQYLGQKKVILLGTSWGSVLGVKMALQRPDFYRAYIGHAQVVNAAKALSDAFHQVQQMAKSENDSASIQLLKAIGEPPYDDAKNAGQLFRVIKKYEKNTSKPAPSSWWVPAAFYNSDKDHQARMDGDDYSFINFVGHKKLGVEAMMQNIDFMKENLHFKMPFYLIQGANDILTNKNMTKEFFDKLAAPQKQYVLLPNTAHGHNQAVIDAQYKILTTLNTNKKTDRNQ